jgi:penicillin amidase
MQTILFFFVTSVLSLNVVIASAAEGTASGNSIRLPELNFSATIVRDANNIAYIRAHSEHDVFFLQGWTHAQDRLFQMDVNRRLPSGTLAELVGADALNSDVTLRTIGMRRAAARSLAALLPETRAALQAYADGVNAWVRSHPLPPEYGALEITQFGPWSPTDSVVIAKLIAFSLSFELDVAPTVQYMSYVQAGSVAGFDGARLFHEDLVRSAPFDPAATVPDASMAASRAMTTARTRSALTPGATEAAGIRSEALELARDYLANVRQIPLFDGILDKDKRGGSNLWAIGGSLSDTGNPLIANDPHLQLGTPSTFYPMGLKVSGGLKVFGECIPGAPGIVQGYNSNLSWGTTNNLIDVTDTYQEQVVSSPTSPSGLATLYQGQLEAIIPIPETFRANQPGNGVRDDIVVIPPIGGVPAATLVVPRRNQGPIISLDLATGVALSVQYSGFSPTRELDSLYKINQASNMNEFIAALQFFDFGSQNFVFADDKGNIAYFTSGEMPVREDLQADTVTGSPPWFIRNGLGENEWLAVRHPQPNQALPYEILPFAEMPQIANPPAGFLVNGNNDPAGVTAGNNPLGQQRPNGGIYYLAYAFNRGFRAGRIKERIVDYLGSGNGHISFEQMQSIQADVKLRDAQVFVPYIVQALDNAGRDGAPAALADLAGNMRLTDAVNRLSRWSFETPTGIPEGYDATDANGRLASPTPTEIQDSVAATIFAVWRAEFVKATIDAQLMPFGLPVPQDSDALAALRNLLDNFADNHGVGASGVNFFSAPGLAVPEDARDFVILGSVESALDALASNVFGAAFQNSTDLENYRWGKLHRIVFAHPLGGPFSIPPAGSAFPQPLPGLPGIPTDGGFQTVDASNHTVRAGDANAFMFNAGPVRRFVGERSRKETRSESIWPGGTSGVLGSPWYLNFLPLWLTNEAIPLHLDRGDLKGQESEVTKFVPGSN